MGKASKWFRKLFGRLNNNNSSDQPKTSSQSQSHEKRRWSFVKSCKEKHHHHHHDRDHHYGINNFKSNGDRFEPNFEFADHDVDPGKRAIAVAAATAAAAEAAVAAAQAAAAVVRMSERNCCYAIREVRAAVMIQAAFRGCLARKALRALKGLVRLQALVRGNIERKRTAKWLQRMQTLMRAQKRACIGRSQISELTRSNSKSSQFHPISPATPENFEHSTLRTNRKILEQTLKLKRNGSISKSRVIRDQTITDLGLIQSESWANEQLCVEDERSHRVFDVNPAKTRFLQKHRNPFHLNPSALVSDQYNHTISKESTISSSPSCEIQYFLEPKNSFEFEEGHLYVIDDSPQYFSTLTKCDNSKRSPFTPTKSDGSRSCFNGYPDYPNYMADTESSKAKVRSLSAPRQRPGCEKLSPTDRYSVHDFVEARSSAHSLSSLHASFIAKAYPGSGRLDSLGMPKSYIDY